MTKQADEKLEEILEAIWTNKEEGKTSLTQLIEKLKKESIHPDGSIEKLKKQSLIKIENGKISLTPEGRERAKSIIRRHRLAERLFVDLLEMGGEEIEGPACRFEHAISGEVEEKICTLLGHPRECPHGKPIPQGQCCLKSQREVESAITTLAQLKVGEGATVTYLTMKDRSRLQKLASLGLMPGVRVKVLQKFPSLLVQVEETQIAMENKVAGNIYVKKLQEGSKGQKGRGGKKGILSRLFGFHTAHL